VRRFWNKFVLRALTIVLLLAVVVPVVSANPPPHNHAEVWGGIKCLSPEPPPGTYEVSVGGKYVGDGEVVAKKLFINGQEVSGSVVLKGCGKLSATLRAWFKVRFGWDWCHWYKEYEATTTVRAECPCYVECSKTRPEYGDWSGWGYKAGKLCRERTVTYYDKYTGKKCRVETEKECKPYKECTETKPPVYGDWGPEYYDDKDGVCRDRTKTFYDKYTGVLCRVETETTCRPLTSDEGGACEVTFADVNGVVFEGTDSHRPDEEKNYYRAPFGAVANIQLTAQRDPVAGRDPGDNGITRGELIVTNAKTGAVVYQVAYEVRLEAFEQNPHFDGNVWVFSQLNNRQRIELPLEWTLPSGPDPVKLHFKHNTYFGGRRVWSEQYLYVPGKTAWKQANP